MVTNQNSVSYVSELLADHYEGISNIRFYTIKIRSNKGAIESRIDIDYLATTTQPNPPTPPTYNITYDMSNVTSSNPTSTVGEYATFETTLSADSGYTWITTTINYNGYDVTNDYFDPSTGNISIPNVEGDIYIYSYATDNTAYTITNNLTNVRSSNRAYVGVEQNGEFRTTLSPESGYSITNVYIEMDGIDITNSVLESGWSINIPSVTGNVVITAAAELVPVNIYYNIGEHVSLETDPSGLPSTATYGSSLSGTFTFDEGYDLDTITIYVGSQDVTYDVLSGNTFTINNINEAISIAIYAQSTVSSDHNMTYSIGKDVSLSYTPDTIEDKNSYLWKY